MKTVIPKVAVMVFASAVGLGQLVFAEEKLMPDSVHLSPTAMHEIFQKKGSADGDYVNVPFQDRMDFDSYRLIGGVGRDYFSFSFYRWRWGSGRVQTSVDGVIDSWYPTSSTGRSNIPSYTIGFAFTSHIRSRGEIASSQ